MSSTVQSLINFRFLLPESVGDSRLKTVNFNKFNTSPRQNLKRVSSSKIYSRPLSLMYNSVNRIKLLPVIDYYSSYIRNGFEVFGVFSADVRRSYIGTVRVLPHSFEQVTEAGYLWLALASILYLNLVSSKSVRTARELRPCELLRIFTRSRENYKFKLQCRY